MLLPVANRPGWLQDPETHELWVPNKKFCAAVGINPRTIHIAKSIHSSKYRIMTLGGRLLVSWTFHQAQARLCIAGGRIRRLPCRDFIPRPSSKHAGGGDAREKIARIQAES